MRLRSGRGRRREGGGGCGDQCGRRHREDERVVCGQGQVRLTVHPGLWGGQPGEVREGGGSRSERSFGEGVRNFQWGEQTECLIRNRKRCER